MLGEFDIVAYARSGQSELGWFLSHRLAKREGLIKAPLLKVI
jgi:hypothetical protein